MTNKYPIHSGPCEKGNLCSRCQNLAFQMCILGYRFQHYLDRKKRALEIAKTWYHTGRMDG